tara:strand:- start:40 stop:1710 length:1671 start_codon:yes stop_codon:yes gene_type:complete
MAFDLATAKITSGGFDISTAQPEQELRPSQAATPMNEDFIPTSENLAAEQARTDAIPERTLGESVIGAGDALLTAGTAATGGALGFGAGTVTGILGELTGRLQPGEGLEEAQALAAKLTRAPVTEAGQEYLKDVGDALGALPPVLGTTPVVGLNAAKFAKVGKPKFASSRNKIISSIANDVPENVQKSFTKKLGKDRFQPHIFGMVKEARRQGFDEGVTTLVANASPTTRRGMMRQVGVVEKAKGSARVKALERTADIAGESLVRKHDFVLSNKKQAGVQLGRVAKKLKKESLNIDEPVNSFLDGLERLGVKFDEKGRPNYENATFEGVTPAETLINKVVRRIKRNEGFGETDGLSAHEFKKFIDEQVSFGKKSEGGLGNKVEGVVKTLRREVNDSISSISKDYAQANKQFSDTVTVLDELEKVAGQKLDFSGKHATKAAGTLLRSQTNNTKGRANLLTVIENLESTAKKYGGSFDDDILSLSIFADELDTIFGSGASTSLRGEVGKAGVDTAVDISQMTIPGVVGLGVKSGARRIRGINEKNQLKSIKKLLKGNK